ncbi:glycosyltransferase family 39 protein [Portibacter lacus]|uniref:Dolichyl-phosphate-mannose--protein mannosyltransferase n=1 Tax=Portibacter lacus TaxID=1099794 RepID=A0AA37WH45_9BACT|nr:glycosyltransferase family 39 protein [Portibacter lacus]GLR18884.1 dolichyl-phosphate-mannose--protein mannosyltransferase [Portibacter lacus]
MNIPVFQDDTLAIHNDSYYHLKLAENITLGNGFSSCSTEPFYKNTIITPGYPYFLASVQSLFGKDLRIIIGIQVLIDLLICWLLFLLSKSLFNRKVGLLAVLFYSVSSHAITYSGLAITESVFSLVLLLTVYVGINAHKKYDFLLLAVLYGLLVSIRPIAFYLLPIIGFMAIKDNTMKQILRGVATVMIGGLIVFTWMSRNHSLTGLYSISSIQEYNLYFTFANAIESRNNNRHENDQREILMSGMEHKPLAECGGDYAYVQESRRKGLEILRSNKLQYAWLHFKSIPNMFLPEVTLLSEKWGLSSGDKGTLGVINKEGFWAGFKHYSNHTKIGYVVMLPFILIWMITLLAAGVGILKFKKKEWQSGGSIILLIIFYFMIIPGPAGNGRFLMPVIPLICMIAALGVSKLNFKYGRV